MKKNYLIFLYCAMLSFFGQTSFAQVTLIPDPAFEQLLISNGYDTLLNGEVPTENISSMYSLYLYDLGITDLTGIQDFTSLQILFCYKNNLTNLDVSNLQSLRELNCGNNKLSNLNVAGLQNLETLVIGENLLTSLDLSGLPSLKAIHGSSNPLLTQVNVSSPNITYIDLRACGLTSFDATDLPLLETLNVSENDLTSLQVSGISALGDLSCYRNALFELDLTGTNLTTLYCGQNNLTALSLKNQNALTTLDVTNNPLLRCIEVDDQAASDGFPSWYKDSNAKYRVNCDVIDIPDPNFEQALIDLGFDTMIDGAVSKTIVSAITVLDVSNKNIENLSGIEEFPNLTELNCSHNSISGTIFYNPAFENLQKLDCSNNLLYILDTSYMVNLVELNISNSQLSALNIGAIGSLKKLECSNIGLNGLSFYNLPNLERLVCSHNSLTNLDLQSNNHLKYLDCSYNSIQNVPFSSNHPLEYFHCNNNQLFRVETFNLPNLKELHCYSNTIYDIDIRDLVQMEHLDISHNQITNMWITPLPGLKTFICNNNYIGKLQLAGFESLSRLDCQNNSLTFLNLRGTALTTVNCAANALTCISIDNPEMTIDNPSFQKDEAAAFLESCQTGPFTLIPDVNFEKVLLKEGHDEILDGKVATSTIAGISFLPMSLSGISDLTGIQDFTSLSSLDLQGNNLTSLDALSGMSWLVNLYCSENQFIDLDLDGLGLSGVETFFCTNSPLQSINFGNGMPNVSELYLYENQLTELDLSMLQNVYMAECYSNGLASLNITGMQNLTEIDCSDNQLTGLDLSGLENLESLNCSKNNIMTLDFSVVPNVYNIDCYENSLSQINLSGLENLYSLDCSNNSLTQLALSDCVNLETLYCRDNQLTAIDFPESYLYNVECSGNKLTVLDLSALQGISSLYCDNNELTSLILHPSIEYLACDHNFLTSIDLSGAQNMYGINIDSNYLAWLDLTAFENVYYFSALDNPYLKCIKVSNAEDAQSNWGSFVNGDSYFAETCNSCANATLWNGSAWTPTLPDSNSVGFIKGAFTVSEDMDFCSLVVLENASLIVPSGKNIHVSGTLDLDTTASFVLESNANLTQSGSTDANRGLITVKRDAEMRRLDYVYWSSPVKDVNLFAFSDQTLPNRFYTLDEATNQFVSLNPLTTNFLPAHGYMIRAANTFPPNGSLATFTGLFTGAPNNGDMDVDAFHTPNKGFNLIGNPYPSTLDADAFMDANPDIDALYFWTHGSQNPNSSNYATYNASGGTQAATTSPDEEPNGTIQVGQGFLAKMTAEAASQVSVHFTNDMRVANNENQFYRLSAPIEKNRIWLNLSAADKRLNQVLTGYITNATNAIDSRYDGKLIEANGSKLYNLIENQEYVIQAKALPFSTEDSVDLGFKAETAGNFTISLDHADGLFSGDQSIYIKDNLTGIIHDIKQNPYLFYSEAGTHNSRFQMVYQVSLGIGDFDANTVVVYNENQLLHIKSGKDLIQEIMVFDIRGRLLYEKKQIDSNAVALDDLKALHQVLLVQIKLDEQRTITKKALY